MIGRHPAFDQSNCRLLSLHFLQWVNYLGLCNYRWLSLRRLLASLAPQLTGMNVDRDLRSQRRSPQGLGWPETKLGLATAFRNWQSAAGDTVEKWFLWSVALSFVIRMCVMCIGTRRSNFWTSSLIMEWICCVQNIFLYAIFLYGELTLRLSKLWLCQKNETRTLM